MIDLRINGFASGMDIDSMVRDLMKAESMPLQKMEKEKQELQWKRDDYREMNTLLLDFRSQLTQMKLTTSYRSREVSSTDESKVTATASSAANETSFKISEVKQLASSATLKNAGPITADGEEIDESKSLYPQFGKFDNQSTETWKQGAIDKQTITAESDGQVIELGEDVIDRAAMNVQVNGQGYKVVTDETATLAEDEVYVSSAGELTFADGVIQEGSQVSVEYVKDAHSESKTLESDISGYQLAGGSIVNNANFQLDIDGTTYSIGSATGEENEFNLEDADGGTIGTINTNTGRLTFDNELSEGTNLSVNYQQNYSSFSVGAHTDEGETHQNFLVTGDESLNQVVNKVNKADIGVSMMYDSFTDRMTISRTETGNFNEAGNEIMRNGTFINNMLKFGSGTEEGGDNAVFSINGIQDTERHSNNFEIDGVTFNLKQTFTEAEGPVSINVSNDSGAVFENIKEFVENYNTLIDAVNGKVNEEYYRDYGPLTDDQRESLTETQQEDWEERAKSGLLRRDSILQSGLNSMRTDFYSPVNNEGTTSDYNQLASIGITTTSNYMDGGKLEIDEAKLKAAIEDDPSAVESLFRGSSDEYGQQGVVHRLYDTVNGTMDRIYDRAGRTTSTNQQFTIGRNLNDVQEQIRSFQDRLTQIEDRYYSQFTRMEKAMQEANQQAAYMQQQFGGGMGMMG
ncbi:flagellar filament capping protein FliD [Gracilibacillus sp. YIM 98692]|uniref:flagellar filament capping protein FliD n=1 Tax=Gracilibacillus sp. YIM 98692 TaxID=2663532 RepID=UPI001F091013|nr:flagellar filament capping protein FliD [Gracilibacillus sp. YIM 98692]